MPSATPSSKTKQVQLDLIQDYIEELKTICEGIKRIIHCTEKNYLRIADGMSIARVRTRPYSK